MKAKNVLDKLKDLKLRRWGPAEYTEAKNSNEGGGEPGEIGSDVFFVPATIQPKYFVNENSPEPTETKNYTSDITWAFFLYNKEDIISLGIEETELNSLTQVTIQEAFNDANSNSPIKGLSIDKEVFINTIILNTLSKEGPGGSSILIYSTEALGTYYVYKISDDAFFIKEHLQSTDPI